MNSLKKAYALSNSLGVNEKELCDAMVDYKLAQNEIFSLPAAQELVEHWLIELYETDEKTFTEMVKAHEKYLWQAYSM